MTYLFLLLGSLVLLSAFFALTRYETQHQVRFYEAQRARLDKSIDRIEFIIEHVDLAAFVRDEVRHAMNHTGHAIAHFSLQAVRTVEHLLTRLVLHLRVRKEGTAVPHESAREFVKTLSSFKDELRATHPDISDIK